MDCANFVTGYDTGDLNADLCLAGYRVIESCPKDCPYCKPREKCEDCIHDATYPNPCSDCEDKSLFEPREK